MTAPGDRDRRGGTPGPVPPRQRPGGRAWGWGLAAAVAIHAAVFLFLPGRAPDALRRASAPGPGAFVARPGPSEPLRAVTLPGPPDVGAPPAAAGSPPPSPAPERRPVAVAGEPEATPGGPAVPAPETATAPVGAGEGAPAGEATEPPPPPRLVHFAVPALPPGIDGDDARRSTVGLLLEVLPDGRVGAVRIERGSAFAALDTAAVAAARRMRYAPDPGSTARWTRAEIRF